MDCADVFFLPFYVQYSGRALIAPDYGGVIEKFPNAEKIDGTYLVRGREAQFLRVL